VLRAGPADGVRPELDDALGASVTLGEASSTCTRAGPADGGRPELDEPRLGHHPRLFVKRADQREERPRGRVGEKRVNVLDPIIPDHITGEELPRAVRNELRTLPEGLALRVARHLAASVEAATVNPEISWQHAKAALSKASRVGIIREAAAEAAYNAGHYAEALIEFRAARRMRGIKEYWPLMADCERACGRPMKAIEMAGDPLVKNLDHASRVEMRIVAAGARMDMGNLDAALATLQCPDLTVTSLEPWSARIRYAYADVLEQMDRREEALEWFHRAAAVDVDMLTDSDQRIRKLEGKPSDSDNDDEYGYEDLEDFDYSGEFGDQEDSGDNDEAIKE
jgi:tetratricopeptide (TPR) repeat protein